MGDTRASRLPKSVVGGLAALPKRYDGRSTSSPHLDQPTTIVLASDG